MHLLVKMRIFPMKRLFGRRTLTYAVLVSVIFVFAIWDRPLYHTRPFKKSPAESLFDVMRKLEVQLIVLDVNATNSFISGSKPQKLITFGIFQESVWKMEFFERWEKGSDWKIIESRGLDYRLMSPKKENSTYKQVVTHMFLIFDSIVVHLAVVFLRNNFFWIPSINETSLPSKFTYLANFTFGVPIPMAVDKFECVDGYEVLCIPKDLDYYLWQLPRAYFYECNYENVVYPFNARYPDFQKGGATVDERDALERLYNVTKSVRIPIVIFCGTLLGWMRQCDYIVHSKDIDTAAMIYDYKPELINKLFRDQIIQAGIRYGTLETGLEIRTRSDKNVWSDIFFLYENEENLTMHMWNAKWWYHFDLPKSRGICSAELFGVLVYLFCNYDEFIYADYGRDGWFGPNMASSAYANVNMFKETIFEDEDIVDMTHIYEQNNCTNPNLMWGCDPEPPEILNSTAYQRAKSGNDTLRHEIGRKIINV